MQANNSNFPLNIFSQPTPFLLPKQFPTLRSHHPLPAPKNSYANATSPKWTIGPVLIIHTLLIWICQNARNRKIFHNTAPLRRLPAPQPNSHYHHHHGIQPILCGTSVHATSVRRTTDAKDFMHIVCFSNWYLPGLQRTVHLTMASIKPNKYLLICMCVCMKVLLHSIW